MMMRQQLMQRLLRAPSVLRTPKASWIASRAPIIATDRPTCCFSSSSSSNSVDKKDEPAATTTPTSSPTPQESAIHIRMNLPETPPHIPGAETGGRKLAAMFTCKVCHTRSIKQFTERAYNYGVVIVQCDRCRNRHLLADRLGYFDDENVDLERIAKENGETLTIVDNSTAEIDLERLLGKEKLQELIHQSQEDSSEKS